VGNNDRGRLPITPPVKPMLATAVKEIPTSAGLRIDYFRDGDEVEIGSRNEKPMTRYFPELVEAVRANLPERCAIDGEIIFRRPAWDRARDHGVLCRARRRDDR
jgi:ATP-dependent DNA ligase